MAEIKRFDIEAYTEGDSYSTWANTERCYCADGGLVTYDDHKKIVDELEKRLVFYENMLPSDVVNANLCS